jgi:hypothetical protein
MNINVKDIYQAKNKKKKNLTENNLLDIYFFRVSNFVPYCASWDLSGKEYSCARLG